jgi:hypothetical protein
VSGIDDPSDEFFDESVGGLDEAFGDTDNPDNTDNPDDTGARSNPDVRDVAIDAAGGGSGVLDRAMPEIVDADQAFIRAAEAQTAIARAAAIAAGRRKGGVAGAALAGAMFAVAEIYEGPRKERTSVVVEASSDPNDLDADGLEVTVGDVSVAAPALERLEPVSERDRRKRPVV